MNVFKSFVWFVWFVWIVQRIKGVKRGHHKNKTNPMHEHRNKLFSRLFNFCIRFSEWKWDCLLRFSSVLVKRFCINFRTLDLMVIRKLNVKQNKNYALIDFFQIGSKIIPWNDIWKWRAKAAYNKYQCRGRER